MLAVGVLRVGLRPLARLATAATAIATGESDRRLPVDRPHSEVGRLATALNQAFDERRMAEERLRRFIADASHELRTPLATIRGWADLYFQGALVNHDGVETAMTRIVDDADRLTRLVEELFLLARLDQQPLLDTAQVGLTTLVSEVIEDARVADTTCQITLSTPGAVTVTGDPDRLRQVARNLVGNALQHTPPGTPVRVTLHTSPDGPSAVRLTVADDGPGIPEADLEHLFERFYRPAGARSTAGTGLGLAIVQAIVHAHGGTVTVESTPGAGTSFHLTLPAGAPATGGDQPRQGPEADRCDSGR
jgi:two-component system OmpR family sensor kinase